MSTHEEHNEQSPLLQSEDDLPVRDIDASKQNVTSLRGGFITISLGILIFLQGQYTYSQDFVISLTVLYSACNISLLTTTSSTIAAELDAFSEVSWFTSAYLVSSIPTYPINQIDLRCRLPCPVALPYSAA